MSDTFNVMDMARDMASSSNTSVDELFLKNGNGTNTGAIHASIDSQENRSSQSSQGGWTPDADLLQGMEEFSQQPVTYDASEIREEDDQPLRNLMDDGASAAADEQQDEMTRMTENIEKAKARLGISKLQIPPGPLQVAVYNAASDSDPNRAAEKLDAVLKDMIETTPEVVLEWAATSVVQHQHAPSPNLQNDDRSQVQPNDEDIVDGAAELTDTKDGDTVKVVIDKTDLPEVTWTPDDLSKIRKARIVELDIKETVPIDYREIDDADGNLIDTVIDKYVRKNNDVVASLPASRYRCTFTGLSYPEVMDLSTSSEMNTIDGERKKWTLCFNHMKNVSIGPWQEYKWYVDMNGRVVKLAVTDPIPDTVDPSNVHTYTQFEDFLRKTSFADLNFMIWKILCATCMDTEIIQIDCRAALKVGGRCGNTYDWIYSPADLLEMDTIPETVLEEMKRTGEAVGDDVIDNYNEGFLQKDRTVKLPNSGLLVVFGHRSAYDYLETVYPAMIRLEEMYKDDPSIASKGLNYTILNVVKYFLIEKENGRYARVADIDNMLEIIENMSEIDWQSTGMIVQMAMSPYDFKYSLRGLVCPRCKKRSRLQIENLSQLLFIVARSLSSVQVEFKTR